MKEISESNRVEQKNVEHIFTCTREKSQAKKTL